MFKKFKPNLVNWSSTWARLDFRAYFTDTSAIVFIVCASLLAALYLFRVPVQMLINWLFINPLLSKVPADDLGIDVLLLVFLAISSLFFLAKFWRYLLPSINSLFACGTVIVGYFLLRHFEEGIDSLHFHIGLIRRYTYGSVFLFSLMPFLLSYKTYLLGMRIEPGRLSFIEDTPSIEDYQDVYNRDAFAQTLYNHITATSTRSAFAIGIVGDWGSGKSDLNERLKKKLEDRRDTIVLDFNAWRVNKSDVLIESFFKALSAQLRPYNYSIVRKIKNYSKQILQPAKEIQYKLLDTLIGEWFPEEDIQTQYESINRAITATGKRLVIFIDDTDRLSSKEVMEVLRLVRNTANFANTFFVVGIDHAYILSVISQGKEFANEVEYLKKIFQFTITLPSFKKDIFLKELLTLLETSDLEEREKRKLKGGLTKLSYDRNDFVTRYYEGAQHDDILENMLETMRDLKRFANSFKVAFNLIKDEADIHDLIVLELIRNKSVEVYNLIRSREIIDFKPEKLVFGFNQEKWEAFEQGQGKLLSTNDLKALREAVEYLFKNPGYKNSRQLMDASNFYIYFSFQLFNQIPMKEFNGLLQKDADHIVVGFNGWIDDRKEKDLLKIIGALETLPDSDFLHKMIGVFVRVNSRESTWFAYAGKLFFAKAAFNLRHYFAGEEDSVTSK
jgi:hypothetical protein